ncbi:hypothetical protein QYF61_015540 [Mycteria americana]|uniref:Uncharacterized protein n=1 Tax=Mycteria americana TaxID=33587 RepID=A0AAN7ND36_MYCAM|nr:hypothetical protein QYF61_015540 [Mycteria americana]
MLTVATGSSNAASMYGGCRSVCDCSLARSQSNFKEKCHKKLIFHASAAGYGWRIIEWFGLEGTFKGHLVQPPCNKQGHLQLDQVAQSPVQPDTERFQGWGIYHLSGQPMPAEQPQLSSSLGSFSCPSSDPLQQLHILLVLRAPELDAVLQLFIHQYPQVLLCRAALNPFIPQPVLTRGVPPTHVQDPALGLVEPHEVHTGPLLELVQVPLDGIPSLRHVNHTTQLGVVCELVEGALNPTVCVIDEDIKQYWSQYGPLRDTTCHQPPSGH